MNNDDEMSIFDGEAEFDDEHIFVDTLYIKALHRWLPIVGKRIYLNGDPYLVFTYIRKGVPTIGIKSKDAVGRFVSFAGTPQDDNFISNLLTTIVIKFLMDPRPEIQRNDKPPMVRVDQSKADSPLIKAQFDKIVQLQRQANTEIIQQLN